MATYFKYAERNASTDVNWAEISKNLTDTLKEENRVREEKKAAIDEASRLYGETLANAPTGESKDMNEWALKFASDAQEARLLQDRLLKSGQLKLKDYTIMRQNLTDGTKTAFSLSDEYQKEYKEKMERAKSSDPATRSQALEEFYMAQAEGFANFKNTNLYINPTNYQVSVGKMYKGSDGVYKMSENPNDFFTVNELRNRMKDKFDYFDYDKSLNQWVGSLGKYSEVVNAAGGWKVITDPLLRDKLDPATKKSVNQLLQSMDNELKSYIFANPYNGTSLLTEDIGTIDGKAVNFTFDPAEAAKNKNLVLLKKDPNNPNGPAVPEFSDEQKDIMLNFMKTQATVKLEHTEEYKQKTQYFTPEHILARGDAKRTAEDSGNMAAKLYAGTDEEVTEAINYFSGLSNVDKFKRTKDGISVTLKDKDGTLITKDISFKSGKDGKPIGVDGFVRSATALLLGDKFDINAAVRGANRSKRKDLNTTFEGERAASTKTTNPMESYKTYVDQAVTPALFYNDENKQLDEAEIAENIESALSAIGAEVNTWSYGEELNVTAPNGKETTIQLKDINKAIRELNSFIKANPKGDTIKEQMQNAMMLKQSGAFGEEQGGVMSQY